MKNVAGFDVSRLIAGSLGTLGIILDASLKCMPLPRAETTLAFELAVDDALRRINEWSALPLPLSASCWFRDRLYVRLSGAASAVSAAQDRLGGEETENAAAFWRAIREQQHAFFQVACSAPLWRLSVRSTAPYADLGSEQMIEWAGALRWICAAPDESAKRLRAWAQEYGGHATLFRSADKSAGAFHALSQPLLALHQRLKAALDPAGIFNRHRMYTEF